MTVKFYWDNDNMIKEDVQKDMNKFFEEGYRLVQIIEGFDNYELYTMYVLEKP